MPRNETQGDMFNDQRKARRQSISYSAWIMQEDGNLHGCVLSDVSETGARIDVDSSETIPDHFVLWLASNGAARRGCDVVWRGPHQIGVKLTRLAPVPKKPSLASRLIPVGDSLAPIAPDAAEPIAPDATEPVAANAATPAETV